MVASAANVNVRYAYDASSDSSVVCELPVVDGKPELPEIYVVVGQWAYFADSDGYLVMYLIRPGSPDSSDPSEMSEMPDLSDVFEGSEIDHDGRIWAVNAKWYDESEFGALVPSEMIARNEWVCTVLRQLHRVHENFPFVQ